MTMLQIYLMVQVTEKVFVPEGRHKNNAVKNEKCIKDRVN